jgi:hypothetical protein
MTDATGHKNRPGAGPSSNDIVIEGVPLNRYINHNPLTGRTEIAKTMSRGVEDECVKDFPSADEALAWAFAEFNAGRLP